MRGLRIILCRIIRCRVILCRIVRLIRVWLGSMYPITILCGSRTREDSCSISSGKPSAARTVKTAAELDAAEAQKNKATTDCFGNRCRKCPRTATGVRIKFRINFRIE